MTKLFITQTLLMFIILSPVIAQSEREELSVIATRVPTPVSLLPGNVSNLNKDKLELDNPNHIQQSLNQLPGVNFQRGNGQESLPSIRSAVLTGAGACGSLLVLEEAIPVRGAGFCNINELFDTHFEQANSISVIRGANTAFYGSNALTGSINISLPAHGDNLFSIEGGPNGYVRSKLALSYGDQSNQEDAYGRIYLTVGRDGGYRDDSGYNQQKLSWRHAARIGAWHTESGLTATKLDQETAGFITGFNSYLDPELSRQNLDPEAFRKTESLRAWFKASKELNEQQSIYLTTYVRHTDMDFLQHFLPGDPLEQNSQTGVGLQLSFQNNVSTKLSFTTGLDIDVSKGELKQTQDAPTQGSEFLQETIPAGVQYDYEVVSSQIGIFTHLNWTITNKLKLIAGLRGEQIRYDYDNQALDGRTRDDGTECGFGGCRFSRPADRDDSFTNISPKLELQYTVNDQLRFDLILADAYRAPQATELYRLQGEQTVADLDNVQAFHIDFNVHWQTSFGDLHASIYQIQQDNLIIRDSDFFNVDGTQTKSRGIELGGDFRLYRNVSLNIAATFADHRYSSDVTSGGININGNQIDTAPKTFGTATLNWHVSNAINSALEIQHVGEYFLDPENLNTYPGHTLLNLRTQYKITENTTASLRIVNVANKRFAERADFTSFTQERYFPGEPRSAFFELSTKF